MMAILSLDRWSGLRKVAAEGVDGNGNILKTEFLLARRVFLEYDGSGCFDGIEGAPDS